MGESFREWLKFTPEEWFRLTDLVMEARQRYYRGKEEGMSINIQCDEVGCMFNEDRWCQNLGPDLGRDGAGWRMCRSFTNASHKAGKGKPVEPIEHHKYPKTPSLAHELRLLSEKLNEVIDAVNSA